MVPFAFATSFLLLAAATRPATPLHLGDEFSIAAETPIEEVVGNPERYHNRPIRTRGVVASVCNEEGCFIEVVPRGGGAGIVANFPGLVHTFPLDCAGLEATVEGVPYRKIFHSARVSHWQRHSYHVGRSVPEYSMILRMEVRAAEIGGERIAVPEVAAIPAASPTRVDLLREEFEDEGFGIGRQRLEANVTRAMHWSAAARVFVVCTAGSVSVDMKGAERIRLSTDTMAYVPAGTPYWLTAEGGAPAEVLIVYANVVKKEPEHKH
ncbi:MAG: cupin domain-containing protein [Acidobacteriota bacterium]